MAVNTARSSTGAVPPPCGRALKVGIHGSANAHNLSGTRRRDSSCTQQISCHRSADHNHVGHALSGIDAGSNLFVSIRSQSSIPEITD